MKACALNTHTHTTSPAIYYEPHAVGWGGASARGVEYRKNKHVYAAQTRGRYGSNARPALVCFSYKCVRDKTSLILFALPRLYVCAQPQSGQAIMHL
jgi:hypothetical protein